MSEILGKVLRKQSVPRSETDEPYVCASGEGTH